MRELVAKTSHRMTQRWRNTEVFRLEISGHIRNICTSIQRIYAIIWWCSVNFFEIALFSLSCSRTLSDSSSISHFNLWSLSLSLRVNKDKFTHGLIQNIYTLPRLNESAYKTTQRFVVYFSFFFSLSLSIFAFSTVKCM